MQDDQEVQQEVEQGEEQQEVLDAAPVVDEEPHAEKASSFDAEVAAKVEEIKRNLQSDYTRKMQELAKQREELAKQREELAKQQQQPAAQQLEDIMVPGDIESDPLGGPLKALTMREKMLRAELAAQKALNEELRNQVSSVADLVLEQQFERQFAEATAEGGYAAGLNLDRDAVRKYIAEHGLSREPRTMVREAIKSLAAEQYLERLKAQQQPERKRSSLPKSSGVSPSKVAMTPREEAIAAVKRMFGK